MPCNAINIHRNRGPGNVSTCWPGPWTSAQFQPVVTTQSDTMVSLSFNCKYALQVSVSWSSVQSICIRDMSWSMTYFAHFGYLCKGKVPQYALPFLDLFHIWFSSFVIVRFISCATINSIMSLNYFITYKIVVT